MPESPQALEEVTQAAFNGVLRALEARKLAPERWPGPIIVDLVAWPELQGAGAVLKAAPQQAE